MLALLSECFGSTLTTDDSDEAKRPRLEPVAGDGTMANSIPVGLDVKGREYPQVQLDAAQKVRIVHCNLSYLYLRQHSPGSRSAGITKGGTW